MKNKLYRLTRISLSEVAEEAREAGASMNAFVTEDDEGQELDVDALRCHFVECLQQVWSENLRGIRFFDVVMLAWVNDAGEYFLSEEDYFDLIYA